VGTKYSKNIFVSFLLSVVCILDPKAAPTSIPQFISAPDSKSRCKLERGVSLPLKAMVFEASCVAWLQLFVKQSIDAI